MVLRKDQKDRVHVRLLLWGEVVSGGIPGLPSPGGLLIAGSRSPQGARVLWSEGVEEIERAVNALPPDERAVIVEMYTVLDATTEQHCRALGCSAAKLYRVRDRAMYRINELLREWQKLCG